MPSRPPPKLSSSSIEKAALHYLERFASSSANLKRVLMRKASRAIDHWGGDPAETESMIDDVVAKLTRLGYLNDATFAANRAASLHAQGRPAKMIVARLVAKGVAREAAEAAARELAAATSPLEAAVNFAKRRRLGPFRATDRAGKRNRDLAAMARAGFDYVTASRIVDAADPEDLTELVG